MSPEERDDELLAEYLKGDSEISRLYRRGTGEQPGADLDARILSRARREVDRKHRVVHSPFARHWMVPASLAAVMILTVSVIVLMPDPALETGVPPDTGLDAPDAVEMSDEKEEGSAVEPTPAPASAPAPAESRPRREHAFEDKDAGRQRAGEAVGKTSEKRKSVAAERDDAPGAESVAPFAGAASNAAPAALEESARVSGAIPARAVQDDPRRWLRHIEMLLGQQSAEQAKDSLRAFRARYPDFPLPASLVPLAESLDAKRQ
jgi:hypothetical protein